MLFSTSRANFVPYTRSGCIMSYDVRRVWRRNVTLQTNVLLTRMAESKAGKVLLNVKCQHLKIKIVGWLFWLNRPFESVF